MTILLAMLIAVQPAPELVEQADQANQAFIGCLFSKSREAHTAGLPTADFRRRLDGACLAEEQSAKMLAADVLAQRGRLDPAAAAQRLMDEARRSVVATYESLPNLESQLERLAEICRQRPDACD